jgi:heme-degrading monooxygenase HmoA
VAERLAIAPDWHHRETDILGEAMIVRAWRGYGAVADAQAYPKHLLQSVRPKLEQMAGFRGVYLLRRRDREEMEFLVLTLWDSMDAVHAFAGEQPEQAVVEPEARAALLRFDNTVQHYEVLAAPNIAG